MAIFHIVVAGQSNALGFGTGSSDPPAAVAEFSYGETYIRVNDSPRWVMLKPGLTTGTDAAPKAWGPEVEIAQRFRSSHPTDVLLITKSVKGETALARNPGADWSPDSEGELFDKTTKRLETVVAGGLPSPTAVFWLQGEQDATRADWARAYAAHLTRFVAEVRSRWMHDPDGRVVIGLVSESRELPFGEVVRAAQREVDEADPRVSAAPSTGMALQPDHIHLSPVGMAAMGAAMFESWDPSDS